MERSLKAFKENFLPLTKVFLEVEILSNEKGQSLQHLILNETTTKLKEKKKKDKQEKLKKEKLNQIGERYDDKT